VRRLKDSAFRQLDFIFKALELKAQSTRPTDICKRSRSAGRPDAQALAVTGAPLVRSRGATYAPCPRPTARLLVLTLVMSVASRGGGVWHQR
jgi:hypothetical protein